MIRVRVWMLAVLGAAMLAALGTARPAHAAEYQYWSYWTVQDGAWRFASTGPVSTTPPDGSVEGWRFAVTGIDGQLPPSLDPATAFTTICDGEAPAAEGSKRIAVVLDAGTANDAPEGETPPALATECVVIEANANGYQVVSASNKLRTKDGLICAINGYPRSACANEVADRAPASERPSPSNSQTPASDSPTPRPSNTSAATAAAATPTAAATDAASPFQTPSVEAATDESSGTAPWLPAVLVAVIVIVIVGVVVWARRR